MRGNSNILTTLFKQSAFVSIDPSQNAAYSSTHKAKTNTAVAYAIIPVNCHCHKKCCHHFPVSDSIQVVHLIWLTIHPSSQRAICTFRSARQPIYLYKSTSCRECANSKRSKLSHNCGLSNTIYDLLLIGERASVC